jgi:hypothetical protein
MCCSSRLARRTDGRTSQGTVVATTEGLTRRRVRPAGKTRPRPVILDDEQARAMAPPREARVRPRRQRRCGRPCPWRTSCGWCPFSSVPAPEVLERRRERSDVALLPAACCRICRTIMASGAWPCSGQSRSQRVIKSLVLPIPSAFSAAVLSLARAGPGLGADIDPVRGSRGPVAGAVIASVESKSEPTKSSVLTCSCLAGRPAAKKLIVLDQSVISWAIS